MPQKNPHNKRLSDLVPEGGPSDEPPSIELCQDMRVILDLFTEKLTSWSDVLSDVEFTHKSTVSDIGKELREIIKDLDEFEVRTASVNDQIWRYIHEYLKAATATLRNEALWTSLRKSALAADKNRPLTISELNALAPASFTAGNLLDKAKNELRTASIYISGATQQSDSRIRRSKSG